MVLHSLNSMYCNGLLAAVICCKGFVRLTETGLSALAIVQVLIGFHATSPGVVMLWVVVIDR